MQTRERPFNATVMEELQKALSQSDITDKLIQEKINEIIEDLIRIDNPLRSNMTRKPGSGSGSFINNRSVRPTAAFVDDTDARTASESTYDARLERLFRTILSSGSVTRKAQAIGRSYIDIFAEEMASSVEEVKNIEESAIINGDNGSNPKEFDGLRILIAAGQIVDAGTNGTPLTLAFMDEAIDLAFSDINLSAIVMSRRSRRELNALLQLNQRFVEKVEIKGGFRVMSYNEIPVLVSKHISDTQTQGSSSVASDIFFVDFTKTWMEDLTTLQMERLAKTTSQKDDFDVFEDTVLVQSNEKYNARIQGIVPVP